MRAPASVSAGVSSLGARALLSGCASAVAVSVLPTHGVRVVTGHAGVMSAVIFEVPLPMLL